MATKKKENVFAKKQKKAEAIFRGIENIEIEITPPPIPKDILQEKKENKEQLIEENKPQNNDEISRSDEDNQLTNDNIPTESKSPLKSDSTAPRKDKKNKNKVKIENSKYDDIFNLTKVEKLEIVDRNYTIKQRTIKTLTKFAKIKGVSKNSFIVDLIKIGLDEELENITPNSFFGSIGKIRKGGLFLRIPIDYDIKLEEHRAKLEKHFPDDVRLSKSEILDILLSLLLERFNYKED